MTARNHRPVACVQNCQRYSTTARVEVVIAPTRGVALQTARIAENLSNHRGTPSLTTNKSTKTRGSIPNETTGTSRHSLFRTFNVAQVSLILAKMHPHLHTKDNTGMRQDSLRSRPY